MVTAEFVQGPVCGENPMLADLCLHLSPFLLDCGSAMVLHGQRAFEGLGISPIGGSLGYSASVALL